MCAESTHELQFEETIMPHKIATIKGKPAMMYVGETPWHGLGKKFKNPPKTAAEAIRAANLDWQVLKKPVYAFDGRHFCVVPGYRATVNADLWGKQGCRPFGLVGDDYQVLQNCEAFSFFDPVIDSGKVSYETAGALGDGEQIWVLAKVKDDITVKGKEVVEKYLLLSNGHDGRTALQIRFTPVRVVCWNTLTFALAFGNDLLKTHHGLGLHRRLENTQEAVKRILGHYDTLAGHFQRFATKEMTGNMLPSFLEAVFPTPKRKRNQKERSYEEAVALNNELRGTSARLFEEGQGNTVPGIRGTLWAAYNGVTELVDHHLAYDNPWQRLKSVCFGDGERIKNRAFDVALDVSEN